MSAKLRRCAVSRYSLQQACCGTHTVKSRQLRSMAGADAGLARGSWNLDGGK